MKKYKLTRDDERKLYEAYKVISDIIADGTKTLEVGQALWETINDANLSMIIESKIRNFAMTLAFFLNSRYDDIILFKRIEAFTEDYIKHHK